MSYKCIQTKLKATVANDSLKKLGEIRFDIETGASGKATTVLAEGTVNVKMLEGTFQDQTTETTISNESKTMYFGGEGVVSMYPVYGIKTFNNSTTPITLDISVFKYATLTVLSCYDAGAGIITGKISDLALSASSLTDLNIGGNNSIRNFVIDDMPSFPVLRSISVANVASSLVPTSVLAEKCPSLRSVIYLLMSGDVSNLSYIRSNIDASHKGIINCPSSDNNLTGTVESIVGDDTTTYNRWRRIKLPSTVTVNRSTYNALSGAGCDISGPSIIENQ